MLFFTAGIRKYHCPPTKNIPNSELSVVIYKNLFKPERYDLKEWETRLHAHVSPKRWEVRWVEDNALYRYAHLHSTTHEVLVILRGGARLQLGGKEGFSVEVWQGEAVAIPAGVAHKREKRLTEHFVVAGLYPIDSPKLDLLQPNSVDYKTALKNLPHVLPPPSDPFYGIDGALMAIWRPDFQA